MNIMSTTIDVKAIPPGPTMTVNEALKHLKAELDPTYSLLSADMGNTNSMYSLQANTALASEGLATIAYANVSAGNALLAHDAAIVSSAPTQSAIQKASTQYGLDSTRINNNNNDFSNVTQTGMTAVTDLTRQESNAMDSASAVLENLNSVTGLLAGWGS